MASTESNRHGDCFTSHEVSRVCGVAPITVGRWIRAGKLKAFRTVGGHRRILRSDLEAFMEAFGIPGDLGRRSEKTRRVMVVDDDEIMVKVLRELIGTLDGAWEVKGAGDGFEAGRLVETFEPALVFLDLMMPGMDGFEVCRRIKSDARTEHTEIVGITGYFTEENREKLKACGAIDLYRKPIDLETLQEILEQIFSPASETSRG